MARCDTCGNDYDKAFQVTMGDQTLTFDCFECAIHALAPHCSACGCRIIGHGLEAVQCLEGGIDAWAQAIEPTMRRYKLG